MTTTRPKELNRRGNPQRILDLLEADGGWFTVRQLQAEFELRWPQVAPASIQRATQRLNSAGRVRTRWIQQSGYMSRRRCEATRRVQTFAARSDMP